MNREEDSPPPAAAPLPCNPPRAAPGNLPGYLRQWSVNSRQWSVSGLSIDTLKDATGSIAQRPSDWAMD